MSLAKILLTHVDEGRRAAYSARPDLDVALATIVDAGRSAWPEVPLPAEDFIAFLGRCLPDGADLASLRAGELHLVCAYALGIPGASQAIEERYVPRVEAALARIGTPAVTAADVLQELRARLVEMRAPRAGRKGYAGRGDLAAWLCVAAVREAGKRRERQKRERPIQESEAMLLASPDPDPELALAFRTYKIELEEAFREALAELSQRERNVLRYHFVEGLSIDQLGAVYGVHRATAARWITRARDALCMRTRELFTQRVSLSQAGFQRMLCLLESQLSVRLGEVAPRQRARG
jgi:RNA polymerase sigma-70 factor (ECF subfamily)